MFLLVPLVEMSLCGFGKNGQWVKIIKSLILIIILKWTLNQLLCNYWNGALNSGRVWYCFICCITVKRFFFPWFFSFCIINTLNFPTHAFLWKVILKVTNLNVPEACTVSESCSISNDYLAVTLSARLVTVGVKTFVGVTVTGSAGWRSPPTPGTLVINPAGGKTTHKQDPSYKYSS